MCIDQLTPTPVRSLLTTALRARGELYVVAMVNKDRERGGEAITLASASTWSWVAQIVAAPKNR